MDEKDILKEVFNAENNKTKDEDVTVFQILKLIENIAPDETPNSATFSMALDCIEREGKIFYITEKEKTKKALPEIVA